MALVVDIETVGQEPDRLPPRALEILFQRLEEGQPDEEEVERRRRALVERFGLDPATGRIVCIGLLDLTRGREQTLCGKDERDLLLRFWEWLRQWPPDLFVTFNGKSFDFPFINLRSAVLNVPPSLLLPTRPHLTRPHFDVREVLAAGDRSRPGTLDFFCAVFGIASPKLELDGSRMGEAFRQERLEEIAAYCLADCRATAALYQRLKPFYP
jgi:hypothetical protein